MRLVFLGTPQFAVPALEQLAAAGHEIAAVYTQPDRPAGRGQQLGASPVKQAALRLGLTVCQPERIRQPEMVAELKALAAEAMVVVGYGQIIPQRIIDLAPLGIINLHASLLPKYRGAAPIQWAIAQGEQETGVTTMRINAGLDTGEMLLRWSTPIGPDETALEVSPRLALQGARLLDETLLGLRNGTIQPVPQDDAQATLAPILKKEDGQLHWQRPAAEIHNRVRGLLPWPGGFSYFRQQLLHVWRTRLWPAPLTGAPGTMQSDQRRLLVACGQGSAVELLEVQLEGRKRMSGEAFLNGGRLTAEEALGEFRN